MEVDNNGTTWEPVFDTYGTGSIGDIAIHPTNPNIVYVGTGEANNRQTSSFGDGIYKSTDGGKTFQHIGLRETQTIARIVIDPRNPDIVYVAALGPPLRPQSGAWRLQDHRRRQDVEQRQVHRRGHRLHRHRDRSFEPGRPVRRLVSAASHALRLQRRRARQRDLEDDRRRPSWTKITGNGLPGGTFGRIALDVARSNPNVVYAQIEAGQVGQPQTTERVDTAGATEVDADSAGLAAAPAGDTAGAGRGADAGGTGTTGSARHAAADTSSAGAAGRRRRVAVTTGATTQARAVDSSRDAEAADRPSAGGPTDPSAARSERAAASSGPTTRGRPGRS